MSKLPKDKRDKIILIGMGTVMVCAAIWLLVINTQRTTLRNVREQAKKSHPQAPTWGIWCAAKWTPSTNSCAPTACACAVSRATSLTVPSAFEAAPTANSRTPRVSLRARSSSSRRPSSGRMRTTRTSMPRSRATWRQVSELAW